MRSHLALGLWTLLGTAAHSQIVWIPVAPPPAPLPVLVPVEPAPALQAPSAAPTTSQKPLAPGRTPVDVVEHYFIGDSKNLRAYPPANGYGPEVQRIVRIFHLNEDPSKKSEGAKPETSTGAAPKSSAERDRKEGDLLDKLNKDVRIPNPADADKKKQYGPPPPPVTERPETSNDGGTSALAPRITAIPGVFVTKTDANPMGDMEIAFVHIPPKDGMAYAEQRARTDPKGRFTVRLEPGDWMAYFVLPDNGGRRYLRTLKVDPAVPSASEVKLEF